MCVVDTVVYGSRGSTRCPTECYQYQVPVCIVAVVERWGAIVVLCVVVITSPGMVS